MFTHLINYVHYYFSFLKISNISKYFNINLSFPIYFFEIICTLNVKLFKNKMNIFNIFYFESGRQVYTMCSKKYSLIIIKLVYN